jgi:hypothetical protein
MECGPLIPNSAAKMGVQDVFTWPKPYINISALIFCVCVCEGSSHAIKHAKKLWYQYFWLWLWHTRYELALALLYLLIKCNLFLKELLMSDFDVVGFRLVERPDLGQHGIRQRVRPCTEINYIKYIYKIKNCKFEKTRNPGVKTTKLCILCILFFDSKPYVSNFRKGSRTWVIYTSIHKWRHAHMTEGWKEFGTVLKLKGVTIGRVTNL